MVMAMDIDTLSTDRRLRTATTICIEAAMMRMVVAVAVDAMWRWTKWTTMTSTEMDTATAMEMEMETEMEMTMTSGCSEDSKCRLTMWRERMRERITESICCLRTRRMRRERGRCMVRSSRRRVSE